MVVRVVLGVLLLATAGLKAPALWTDPYPPLFVFSSPRWQLAVIEMETLLGFWLLIGVYPAGAWVAALGSFSLLGIVSLYLGVVGHASCGCFGKVMLNPWYTFCIDLVAVFALLCWRSESTSVWMMIRKALPRPLRLSLSRMAKAAIILALGAGVLYAMDRSPLLDALTSLKSESLTVEPAVIEIGRGVLGEVRPVHIQLQNHTDRPIRITGGTANCNCVTIENLPITVPPRGIQMLKIRAKLWGAPGDFQQSFELYTNDEIQPVVAALYEGYIIGTPE